MPPSVEEKTNEEISKNSSNKLMVRMAKLEKWMDKKEKRKFRKSDKEHETDELHKDQPPDVTSDKTDNVFQTLHHLEERILKTGSKIDNEVDGGKHSLYPDFTSYDELESMVDSIINVMYDICSVDEPNPHRQS